MVSSSTNLKLAHPFQNVKPLLNTQLTLFPDSVIHHNKGRSGREYIVLSKRNLHSQPYGVSSALRVLSPGILLKRFDQVRDCLQYVLGLTTGQREVTLKLLRFFAYYGQVYPKAGLLCQEPGSSRATFWRTIKRLGEQNLIQVVNRFVFRPHAQISNLYRFDKLLILIARYLAEHGVAFYQKWLKPYLSMPGSAFWPLFWGDISPGPGSLVDDTT